MRQIILTVLLAICALALSACFSSDQPLIDEATSVTPLKPGNYTATETKPGENDVPTKVKVTTEGNVTVFSSTDKDSNDTPSKVLFRKVQGDYYAMLESKSDDDGYVYMLVAVDGSAMKMFDFTNACKTLEGIADAKKADIASFGVARVEKGSDLDTCYFKTFDDLVKGFKAIIDAGLEPPVTILAPAV